MRLPGDHSHTVPPSWPTTKQGKLLYLVRVGQAVAGIVFCVLGRIESASGLVIASVLEPDPQTPDQSQPSFRWLSHHVPTGQGKEQADLEQQVAQPAKLEEEDSDHP